MGRIAVGHVVAVTFPFSDLKGQKVRPALVVARAEHDDLILCQITSKPYASRTAVRLEGSDFSEGALPVTSYARPDKLFTADPGIVERTVARLAPSRLDDVKSRVKGLFE